MCSRPGVEPGTCRTPTKRFLFIDMGKIVRRIVLSLFAFFVWTLSLLIMICYLLFFVIANSFLCVSTLSLLNDYISALPRRFLFSLIIKSFIEPSNYFSQTVKLTPNWLHTTDFIVHWRQSWRFDYSFFFFFFSPFHRDSLLNISFTL